MPHIDLVGQGNAAGEIIAQDERGFPERVDESRPAEPPGSCGGPGKMCTGSGVGSLKFRRDPVQIHWGIGLVRRSGEQEKTQKKDRMKYFFHEPVSVRHRVKRGPR